jgi:hypothetical protein
MTGNRETARMAADRGSWGWGDTADILDLRGISNWNLSSLKSRIGAEYDGCARRI